MADYQLTLADAPLDSIDPFAEIEGEIPADLRGTLYRNGPGAYEVGSERFHLLDAHAFAASAVFADGAVSWRGRVLDTPLRKAELAAGKGTQRRIFTQSRRHFLDTKLPNLAAHDVYVWGGAPVVCDAPGHYALDPSTLAVRGPAPLESLRPNAMATFCPMPRVDANTGRLCVYVADPGLIRNDLVTFYELNSDWSVAHKMSHRLHRKAVLLHDLAVTATHYVVPEFGHLNVPRVLGGKVPIYACVGFPDGYRARIFLFPKDGSAVRHIELEGTEQAFHLFNAFDEGDDVVVDACVYPAPVDFGALAPPYAPTASQQAGARPMRFRISRSGAVSRTVAEVRVDGPEVNPAFHGRPSRYGYAPAWTSTGDEPEPAAYFWYHGVTKVDFETGKHEVWDAGPRVYCSAPSFAPARGGQGGEDEGYLLAWLTDAVSRRTALAILDARNLARGPLCKLWLPFTLPPVSHGVFA